MGARVWRTNPVTVFPPHLGARDDKEVSSSFHHTSCGEEDPKVGLHPRGPQMSAGSFSVGLLNGWEHSPLWLSMNIHEVVINGYQFPGTPQAVGMLLRHPEESPVLPEGIIRHASDATG